MTRWTFPTLLFAVCLAAEMVRVNQIQVGGPVCKQMAEFMADY